MKILKICILLFFGIITAHKVIAQTNNEEAIVTYQLSSLYQTYKSILSNSFHKKGAFQRLFPMYLEELILFTWIYRLVAQ